MKDLFKARLSRSAFIISVICAVWYFALGGAIFDKMWNTSPAVPLTGWTVFFIPLALTLINYFKSGNKKPYIAAIILSPLLMFSHFILFLFVISKLRYFFIEGKPYFITAGLILLILFFVFLFPRLTKVYKRISCIIISAAVFFIAVFGVFGAAPMYFSSGAVVFAADGEYQIAFSTSVKSAGCVAVNGKTYYDETNGENNVSTLHKIKVPKDELENCKSYTVSARSVILNSGYLPTKGAGISKDYSFRPADESDGLQIYNLSDTHECITGPKNAASYFGDKLDLLILNGDIINDVSSEYQISLIYRLANAVTKGERPVIFTRGNHECNGRLANRLGEYVGCADRGFYFEYSTPSLSLTVLDTCNDMADDNPLISPVANFSEVRKAESEWLKGLKVGDKKYKIIVSHMAYPLKGYLASDCVWNEWAAELVNLTDKTAHLALCGHSHKTVFDAADTEENARVSFPAVRGSLRSDKYSDREGISPLEFTGTALELKDGAIDIKFTNSKKEVLGRYKVEV